MVYDKKITKIIDFDIDPDKLLDDNLTLRINRHEGHLTAIHALRDKMTVADFYNVLKEYGLAVCGVDHSLLYDVNFAKCCIAINPNCYRYFPKAIQNRQEIIDAINDVPFSKYNFMNIAFLTNFDGEFVFPQFAPYRKKYQLFKGLLLKNQTSVNGKYKFYLTRDEAIRRADEAYSSGRLEKMTDEDINDEINSLGE